MKVSKRSLLVGAAAVTAFAMGVVLFVPAAGADDDAEYKGSKSCKKCHSKTYKSWEKTVHGTALDSLKPNEKAEAKTASGLDPAKDYTADASCLACHAVGHGKPGGYAVPDPEDKKAVRKAKSLAHVGCESCHGPGGTFVELHEEIQKAEREYTQEEMLAAGLWKVDEQTCLTCHNEKSPTHAQAEPWDFAAMKEKGTHETIELKYRKQ